MFGVASSYLFYLQCRALISPVQSWLPELRPLRLRAAVPGGCSIFGSVRLKMPNLKSAHHRVVPLFRSLR